MITRFLRTAPVVSAILLSAMLSIPEYCARDFPEIADYCVEQERAAQERIEAAGADPFILLSCRETFPESYAMQQACISIKQDYKRELGPVKPGVNI